MSKSVLRYVWAIALTAIGLAIALVLQTQLSVPGGLVFAGTVAISARYFGTGPGLVAGAASIVAIDLTMLPPLGALEFTHPEELGYVMVFLVIALVINGATHSLHIARTHAEDLVWRTTRLLDVTKALAEAELPRDVANVVITQGLDVIEASVGLMAMVTEDGYSVLDWRPAPVRAEEDVPPTERNGEGPLSEAMRSRQLVWVPSRDELRVRFPRAFDRLRDDNPSNAFLALPLIHGDEVIGGLVLGFNEANAFGANDHTFPQLLAQSVASALARASAFEAERHGRRAAETLAQTREEVLGVVAHDLRNPLGVASSVLQMMSEFDLTREERKPLVASGMRAVRQMGRLIGDLLDVMRIEAGRLALETEEVPASTVVAQAEENIRHAAQEKDISFSAEPPDPSLYIRADRGRLSQVLDNLLGNAVKFTPSGGRVSLRAWRDGPDAVFEVADTGPGVSPENQMHLFDRFWQARSADQRGVGLGLPIAKGIVEAHGGRIWVMSTVGHGSRFYFAIPALPVAVSSSARAS